MLNMLQVTFSKSIIVCPHIVNKADTVSQYSQPWFPVK